MHKTLVCKSDFEGEHASHWCDKEEDHPREEIVGQEVEKIQAENKYLWETQESPRVVKNLVPGLCQMDEANVMEKEKKTVGG